MTIDKHLANRPLQNLKIGFIGLGLMGKPMCLNLQQAGAELIISNRSQAVVEELNQEANITAVTSPKEVGEHADIIILMLTDTASVENVLFGGSYQIPDQSPDLSSNQNPSQSSNKNTDNENGLSSTLRSGSLIIDMGTTAVTPTRDFAARLKTQGIDYIDAPVSGGELGAINASLVIMAGGESASINKAKPIFDVLGSSFVHIGEVGTGQIAKAANQMIVGLTIGAVAEALTLAKQAGADLSKVREALMGGFASSRILELHGQRMIDETFQPGGKVTTQHKDMSQALELATEYNQQLPATKLNRRLYENLIENGDGDLDHSALYLAYKEVGLLD